MNTLVYKRTHESDPCARGFFGCFDCMGRVRRWEYDSVIGVGGIGHEPARAGIAGKLTWVGVEPIPFRIAGLPNPLVAFKHFWYMGQAGPDLYVKAPLLAHHVFTKHTRTLKTFSPAEELEIKKILAAARRHPPSPGLNGLPGPGGPHEYCLAIEPGRVTPACETMSVCRTPRRSVCSRT